MLIRGATLACQLSACLIVLLSTVGCGVPDTVDVEPVQEVAQRPNNFASLQQAEVSRNLGTAEAHITNNAEVGSDLSPAGAVAPSCVHFSQNFWGTITVKNNCSSYRRVKIVIKFGPDSSCHQLAPGGSFSFWSATSVDRLDAC